MMAVEEMHLLAARWHSLCSQAGSEAWCEREELSLPTSTWAWEWALAQCHHCGLSQFPASLFHSKWHGQGWKELVVLGWEQDS